MEYMVSGSKNSPPFTSDKHWYWTDAYKEHRYEGGWPRERPLIQKDPSKGNVPNNYRPITCLPMMWKILTAQLGEKIYSSLTNRGLFPDEQKGCRKVSRGSAELLYVYQHILNESKTRRKNLAKAWIDNKKTYDMVPQSRIINCLNIYKISHAVINFIEKTTKTWRVELAAGGRSLAEIKIQRDIFLGYAPLPYYS